MPQKDCLVVSSMGIKVSQSGGLNKTELRYGIVRGKIKTFSAISYFYIKTINYIARVKPAPIDHYYTVTIQLLAKAYTNGHSVKDYSR